MIIDNAIDYNLFSEIKNILCDDSFKWDYWPIGKIYIDYDPEYNWFYDSEKKTYVNKNPHGDAFFHMAYFNNEYFSEVGHLCEKALHQIGEKNNFKIKNILRIRAGLLYKKQENIINMPHVDDIVSHKVGLFYINNCNGDTLIYNQEYKQLERNKEYENYFLIPESYKRIISSEGFTVKQNIQSRENRFFTFDGKNYHGSVSPTDIEKRVVVNYNFEIY